MGYRDGFLITAVVFMLALGASLLLVRAERRTAHGTGSVRGAAPERRPERKAA